VIASHYVEPAERVVVLATPLRSAPSDDADAVGELAPVDRFRLLDESVGWAWGYAGAEGRVGYVRSETIAAQ
jgi:Bacterial dipeptidyl-peptidase Sh3 domain